MAKLSENDKSTLEVVAQDVVETPPLEIADAHLHLDHLLNRVGEPDLQEYYQFGNKDNNKITELRTILQRESQNS